MVAALFQSSAMAQHPVRPVADGKSAELATVVERTWERATLSAATQGELALARAARLGAESLWAAPPALELSHRDDRLDRRTGRRESEIGLAWPLLFPQQRAARIGVADADVARAELQHTAGRLRIAGEVREAAWSIAAADAELAAAIVRTGELRALAEDVARRVEAGDLARADLLAARGELAAADAAESAARQRLQAEIKRWRVLTGTAPLADVTEAVAQQAPDPHPELALALQTVQRARQRLELTRVTRREAPDLVVRYRQDTPAGGLADQNSVGLAVRIPFGTPDRNLPRDAAALSELQVAEATEARLRERLAAEMETARSATVAAERQLVAEESRQALLRERAQLVEKAFRAGESSLPEYLRALAAANQAHAAFRRQQAELGLARARLNQSLGVLP